MKHVYKFLGVIFILLIIGLSVSGCGSRNDPIALAKQTYDIAQQASSGSLDSKEMSAQQKKLAMIAAKVALLSTEKKKIYFDELMRLSGGSLDSILGEIINLPGFGDGNTNSQYGAP